MIELVIVFFLLINSFYIYAGITSSMLAGFVALMFFVYKRDFSIKILDVPAVQRYLSRNIFGVFAYVFLLCIIPIINFSFDVSYFVGFLGVILQLFCIALVLAYIYEKVKLPGSYFDNFGLAIVYGFVIQTIIQTIAFLIPEVARLIHYTYPVGYSEKIYDEFNGIRGLALSGSAGWGLTIGFGVAILTYFNYCVKLKKISFLNIGIIVALIFGNFFAGRAGFIGLIFGILLYGLSSVKFFTKILSLLRIIVFVVFMCLLVWFFAPDFSLKLINDVFPFVFEIFINYLDKGEIKSWSTNRLMEMWRVEINPLTIIMGDGVFIDDNGSYYKKTDVGYIRNLLFGGFAMVVASVLITLSFMPFGLNNTRKFNGDKKFFLILFAMYSILEAKAMVFGFNKYAYTILIILTVGYLLDLKSPKYESLN